MPRIQTTLILLMAAGLPAAAFFATAPVTTSPVAVAAVPHLCFTAGAITYEVSPAAIAADYRIGIDATHPDLRIQLVDGVESADFSLVDGIGGFDACESAGRVKTVRVVGEGSQADITMSLSREPSAGGLRLFVHSARFSHRDVAALMAAMQHYQNGRKLAEVR
jgi:hypothetical protein